MPNSEADAIIHNVQSQLNTPGKNAEAHAYTQFVTEVDQYALRHGSDAAREMIADLSAQMSQNGTLSRIEVGWLKNDFDKIDTTKEDGGLSKSEISQYKSTEGSTTKADVDAMLADDFLFENGGQSQFDNLAKRNWLGSSDNIIEKCDLRAYDRQQHRAQEREGRHEAVRDDAAPLFEGSPPLMAVLDASHNGECDGRVSERDMRRFLTAYEVNNKTENRGNFPYTDDNAKYVGDLLDGKYPELTGSNFTGFSARALARRAGLDHVTINSIEDYDALKSAYQAKRPVEELPVCINVETPENHKLAPAGRPPEDPAILDETTSQLKEMSVFQKGDGQWRVAKRLLKAGGAKEVSDGDVARLTNDLLAIDGSVVDKHGKPLPMVHPGDCVDIFHSLGALEKHNPKLRSSIDSLDAKNHKAAAARATLDAETAAKMFNGCED